MTTASAASFDQPLDRASALERILGDLLLQAPAMQAAAVVSFDGLPMASALPPGMDEDRVAAMSAALLSLGERAAVGLGRGELSQIYVEGAQGTVFLVSAQDEAVLVAVSAREAKTGLMLFEAKQAAHAVGAVLASDVPVGPAGAAEPSPVEAAAGSGAVHVPLPANDSPTDTVTPAPPVPVPTSAPSAPPVPDAWSAGTGSWV
jgi:predicted regulator of Ras-like GTPase activity (Roadblock/LC7/MglB family)